MKSAQGDYETAFREVEIKWHVVLFAKLMTPFTFWLFVFLALFIYLQNQFAFHFYHIEQKQLFLWSRVYWLSVIMEPAGLVRLLTEFCVQFFIKPYYGALIISAWFTLIGMLTAGIIKRIAPSANLFMLSLFPIVLLFYIHYDTHYSYQGTMAYLLMLWVMYGYFFITHITFRVIYVIIFGVLLFWWAGGVALLFVVCVFLWELINLFLRAYRFIFPFLIVTALIIWSVYASIVGDFRFLLLPDGYYSCRIRPGVTIYFSWIFLIVLLIFCRFMRSRLHINRWRKFIEKFLQLILVATIFWFGIKKYSDSNLIFDLELDYYMRTNQWDSIIDQYNDATDNSLYNCYLNVALAEKGELADRMFSFDQQGVQSIYVNWNREPHNSVLLSDLYFSMGHIALSQRMAFEANQSISNYSGSRMLQRLIQTNLIYGAYPIAEKYLDLLAQTRYYKEWASEHRRFLWNDEAIENDSLLSIKRKCITKLNMLSEVQGLYVDLEIIARNNPAHNVSIEYAGAYYLLSKEVILFEEFIERNYRTDVLPTLLKSYQEAILLLSEQDSVYVEKYDISESVIKRYNEFRRQVLTNRSDHAELPDLLKNSFGDTYWYYYMFK